MSTTAPTTEAEAIEVIRGNFGWITLALRELRERDDELSNADLDDICSTIRAVEFIGRVAATER